MAGSKSSTTRAKLKALRQFVHDYLIELGLRDQAQLLKDFVGGEAFPGHERIAGHPVADYWNLRLTVAAKASPIKLSRAEIGPSPLPPDLNECVILFI